MLDYSLGRSIYYVRTEGGGRWVRKMANFANDSTDRLPEMDAPFLFMKVYATGCPEVPCNFDTPLFSGMV